MKKIININSLRAFFAMLVFSLLQLTATAQDAVKIDEEKVGNWFEQNWMWVVGGVILIILIALFSGGGRKNKSTSTTVVKDEYGNTKRVTTTQSES